MRGYPKCEREDGCNGAHSWHGLACTVANTTYPGFGKTVCGCPSPYDDDYWNGGDQ